MKANYKQQRICDTLISQIERWRDGEDIDSPDHFVNLTARLEVLMNEGCINEIQADVLEELLIGLLVRIRSYGED